MNHTLTTTLSSWIYKFLNEEAKKNKTTKKSVIEKALSLYQKIKLKHEVEKWLSERYQEYSDVNSELLSIQSSSITD